MSDGVLKALIATEPEETNDLVYGMDRLTKSMLDGLPVGIAMLDDSGKITFVNEAWRLYAEASHLVVSDHLVVSNHGVGMNYLEVCESGSTDLRVELREIANGIREIISGQSDEFHMEYPCHGPGEKRWFSVRATRLDGNDPPILLLVYNDVTEQKLLEEEREKIKDELGKRVKELTALHKISRVLQDTEKNTAEVLGEITYILPSAWQYPEITAARIIFDKHEFTTPNFYPTPWVQSADFETGDGKRVVVEVAYLAERPSEHEGPFLLEERSLINSLSEMLNAYLERKLIQGDLKENVARLAKKTRYGEIISTVTNSIHRSINLQDVLENAVESMRKNIDKADNVSVYLVEGKEAVLKAYRGYSDSYVEQVARIPFPKGASWRTIIDGKPRYVADVEKDSIIGPAGKLAGTKSYLSMPIRIEDKVLGCIHVHSLKKYAFDEEELELMEIVAQQIEAAIKNAQQAKTLSEREEQYRVLFEQSSVGVFVFDKEFNITQCNKRLVEIMGSDFNRLIGLNLLELRDKSFTPALYRVLEGQSSYYEGFYEATTGTAKLWLSLRLSPLRDVNGEVVGGMGIVEDVSERIQNEKQLHLHKTALEAAANGIVITDREGTIVWVNPAVTRLTGYSAEELIGENPRIFKSGKQDNALYQNLWNTIISGEVWKGEMVNRRKDGSLYLEEMTITPVRFGGSEVSHFIAVKQDITERKRSDEELRRINRALKALSECTQAVVRVREESNLMNEICRIIVEVAGYHLAWVAFAEQDEKKTLRPVAQAGYEKGYLETVNLTWDDGERGAGPSGTAVRSGKPTICNNLLTDPNYSPWRAEATKRGYASSIAIPLNASLDAKPFGVLNIYATEPDAFTAEEVKQLTELADNLSFGILALRNDSELKRTVEALQKSEERFKIVARATNDAVWDWDLETNQVWYNENIRNLFGYPLDKMGTDVNWWIENLHPEDKEGVVSSIYEVIHSDESYWSQEYRYRCFDGRYAYVLDRGYVLRDNLGKPTRMIGSMMDMTERKQVEGAIKEGQERLELALKGGELGLWDWNIQTGEMEFNERWAEMLGYSSSEIKKHISAWKSMVYPDDMPYVTEILNAHLEGRLPFYEAEYRIRCKGGDFRWILDRGRVFERDKDGKPVRATGTFLDITERKRAEELIKSHIRLQTAIARLGQIALAETDLPNLMNEVVSLVAQTLEVEYCKVLELLPDQAFILRAGVGWKEGCVGHSIVGREIESQAGYTLLSGEPVVVEDLRTEKRFNGPTLLHDHGILSGISVIIAGHDKPFGVLGAHSSRLRKFTSDDISFLQTVANVLAEAIERKLSEEKIREQATLLDVARDAIMVRDLEHRVTYWNRSAERLYGWTAEEAIGENALGLLFRGEVSSVFEAHKNVIEKGEWGGELHQITKDGREITVDSHWTLVRDEEGRPKSIFIVNTDITEKKRLESEFLRSQRMESIGTLAGGIAHDLNNVFQPIMMVSQLLRMKFSDEKSIGLVETLEASAERGANLVKQVLSFARGAEGEHSIIQVRHIISEIDKILKETFPKSIEITTDVPKNLWPISADPTQFHQVMMNLCVNARDAMPNGGALKIQARDFIADENYARMNIEAKAGPYIVIDVTDSGVGIPSEIIDRIFEPFFTTKEPGKGTGLGLSTVFRIVKDHGGFVRVYSEVGKGTKFSVYLPAADTTETRHLAKKQIENLPTGNGELILVVDDEASVREIAKISLVTNGYQAVTANDGAEAIALYVQKRKEIKAVVLDVVMPIMDGPACIRALKKIDPAVKIILVSGLKENSNLVKVENTDIAAFLTKPYTTETLLKTLKEVLTA